jgi:hypothetical protein
MIGPVSRPIVQAGWKEFLTTGDWARAAINARLATHDPACIYKAGQAGWTGSQVTEVLVDGTLLYTVTYAGYERVDYAKKYGGAHGQPVEVGINPIGRIVGISLAHDGSHNDIWVIKHDHLLRLLMYKAEVHVGRRILVQDEVHVPMVDGGYPSLEKILGKSKIHAPIRKPRLRELSDEQKDHNKRLYACRQLNERVIGRIKGVFACFNRLKVCRASTEATCSQCGLWWHGVLTYTSNYIRWTRRHPKMSGTHSRPLRHKTTLAKGISSTAETSSGKMMVPVRFRLIPPTARKARPTPNRRILRSPYPTRIPEIVHGITRLAENRPYVDRYIAV